MTDVIRTTYSRAIAEQNLNPAGGPQHRAAGRRRRRASTSHIALRSRSIRRSSSSRSRTSRSRSRTWRSRTADVDAMIEKLRAQRATWKPVERKAAEGDRVGVDFAGTVDGEPFEGGQGKNISDRDRLGPGARGLRPRVERASRPARARPRRSCSRRTIRPRTSPARRLSSRSTCCASRSGELPELDDEFASSFGLAGGAGSLRGEVRNNMERELKERLRAETKTRAFDALIARISVTVPRALVDQEIGSLQADALRQTGSTAISTGAAARALRGPRTTPRDGRVAGSGTACRHHKIKVEQTTGRAAHQGARCAVREAGGGRAVLSQRSCHDGSGRGVGARGSGRRFLAIACDLRNEGFELQGIHGRVDASAE